MGRNATTVIAHRFLIPLLIALWLGAPAWAADPLAYVPADLNPDRQEPEFALFPIHGRSLIVRLPEELRYRPVAPFGAEGKAVCAVTPRGIMKVEFNPLRQEIIPGSSGVESIWSLTVVKESGHIFVSGAEAKTGCGTFEIDPQAGTRRTVLAGPLPHCGAGGGAVSPDGNRIARYKEGKLEIADVKSRAVRVVGGFGESKAPGAQDRDWAELNWMCRAAWSPDGRWISMAAKGNRIVLIDSDNFDRRKHLGSSPGYGSMAWSPDSKYLLVAKPNSLTSNGSIVAVDMNTGRRSKIKGANGVLAGSIPVGWMDPSIIQAAEPSNKPRPK